ncbi:tRNA (guanine(10)-N(2))-dimethyltransferase [uncultured Methanobrevibacter sp.]|uniref:tRNA (guanine(10)-N(2))-dimethyltransferase n=1 Tax=uncultured Methanobrevibacter sp. TaxID=253161 RepID=UPI0025DEC58A|nr:tRNA (guanine(10)-N(2))-dimethyltransferase [uncultured Methanobrevibacter sp.]
MDEEKNTKIKSINEGLCKIQFPEYEKVSSEAPVFYNPKMELNRDISILAIQAFEKKLNSEVNIGDVFGGSGIRGIRYKKEIDNVGLVAVNDISPLAGKFTHENAINNNISIEEENFEIHQHEANNFLRKNRGRFDVVDIDPFGTPSFFIDSVAASIKRNSLLCVTATDTSALCGTYKAPCIRKYNAKPYKSEYCHENGIRILAGFVALTFAKYQKYVEIKLSHSTEHYMRIYMIVKKGSKATDESLKNIGYISHCKNCLYRESTYGLAGSLNNTCPICGQKLIHAGPLWLGKIQNREFIDQMLKLIPEKQLNKFTEIEKLLEKCKNEAEAMASSYDIHEISRTLKISAPKIDKVMEDLESLGYYALRTHFSPTSIKTDAPLEKIRDSVDKLSVGK